ncbi:TAXI family TRAP transporter solute-binding subunit [Alterisphingorhabdus coralli]|uniref:TAXI family TRAP transporter solute-binding subunit n=1 Tax=Alterisphingorhabdus coralli TaxID=3071408 RepID=A0AA97F8W2_9SPHN|nr:TAXI family TRAP transporter solute-binding subunit [Parasphingorhabdus sp. SCSIO 66989]WOE75192.1 TAXI family TRAP transporter solute-binding subunit [Parasphingorhabdus sp. SCSIO 66989]
MHRSNLCQLCGCVRPITDEYISKMEESMFKRLAMLVACGLLIGASALAQDLRFATIGTGHVTGVSYPAGGAIARVAARQARALGLRVSVEATAGGGYNLQTLLDGEMDFAITNEYLVGKAWSGTGPFASAGPANNLRFVMRLHEQVMFVVAHPNAGIATFDDLKGKKVALGGEGSDAAAITDAIFAAKGWTQTSISEQPGRIGNAVMDLCDRNIDAYIVVDGVINSGITEAATACDAVLVPVTGAAIDTMLAAEPGLRAASIPNGAYRGMSGDVQTIGTSALLVSSTNVDSRTVYDVTRLTLSDVNRFTILHPSLKPLTAERMSSGMPEGLFLHAGAESYFREAGLQ